MSKPEKIRCIIHDDGGPHSTVPTLDINGTKYKLCLNQPMSLPPEAFAALEQSSLRVEQLPADKPSAKATEKVEPQQTVQPAQTPTSSTGNGSDDGAASDPGGVNGGAATPPADPLDHDGDGKKGGSLPKAQRKPRATKAPAAAKSKQAKPAAAKS